MMFHMRTPKPIKTLIKLVVAVTLFGYIMWVNDLGSVAESFFHIPAWVWVICAALTVFSVILSSVRLQLCLPEKKLRTLVYVRLVSVSYSFILPGQLATEGIRVYLLVESDRRYSKPSAAIAVDKILSLLAIIILGVLGIVSSGIIFPGLSFLFAICGVLIFSILVLASIGPVNTVVCKMLNRFTGLHKWLDRAIKFCTNTMTYFRDIAKNLKLVTKSFLLAVLFNMMIVSIGVLITLGMGLGTSIIDWFWIHAALSLLLTLPISIGGFGVREGGLIGLMALVGATSEQALAVSFALLTLQLMQAFVGIVLLTSNAMKKC